VPAVRLLASCGAAVKVPALYLLQMGYSLLLALYGTGYPTSFACIICQRKRINISETKLKSFESKAAVE